MRFPNLLAISVHASLFNSRPTKHDSLTVFNIGGRPKSVMRGLTNVKCTKQRKFFKFFRMSRARILLVTRQNRIGQCFSVPNLFASLFHTRKNLISRIVLSLSVSHAIYHKEKKISTNRKSL